MARISFSSFSAVFWFVLDSKDSMSMSRRSVSLENMVGVCVCSVCVRACMRVKVRYTRVLYVLGMFCCLS